MRRFGKIANVYSTITPFPMATMDVVKIEAGCEIE
jgi:hypothetical protein